MFTMFITILFVGLLGNRFGFLEGSFLLAEAVLILGSAGFNNFATTLRFVSVLFGFIKLKIGSILGNEKF